eukprot:15433883-Alexandrium_andersonii.AAC.1
MDAPKLTQKHRKCLKQLKAVRRQAKASLGALCAIGVGAARRRARSLSPEHGHCLWDATAADSGAGLQGILGALVETSESVALARAP